ncbi:hypothetical protein FHW16_002744 [Phyllobacterium myrsinacearum]|uniref:Uncharacterized protein n=1 Tax=Phyllobacterium myrsinacearum TaxID=28101 RepID=A0A839ENP4_9HYPH|nr:hypothetical protein [Phyllobacterium myrsinacearum]
MSLMMVGFAIAAIASWKGKRPLSWFFFGIIFFVLALPVALFAHREGDNRRVMTSCLIAMAFLCLSLSVLIEIGLR